MRTIEMSAKTVEEAVQAAAQALGVERDDINFSYEVLEFPARRFFKTIPAKIRAVLNEAETPAAAPAVTEAAPVVTEAPAVAAVEEVPAVEKTPAAPATEEEVALDIDADPRLQAAVDYLTPIFQLMGVEKFRFTAVKKGEATILRVAGEHMGVLIGRRGETMESLSYLASLVVNRMEGPYIKLGIDVGGYRGKREDDLAALAGRIAERVVRTGCYYEMEAMNPYERHIIHAAIANIEGVRSESKGEGPARHVVVYSTDPNASNLPDREANRRSGRRDNGRREGGRGPRREGGRDGRSASRGPRREGGRDGRGNRRQGPRPGSSRGYGAPRSNVPAREFADAPRDPSAKPMAPARTEHIHDGEDFAFGKIEL
ncbi:MAG: RNA-binding cell elongation regulator Jag/EloR [Gemmiger sp.]